MAGNISEIRLYYHRSVYNNFYFIYKSVDRKNFLSKTETIGKYYYKFVKIQHGGHVNIILLLV